MNRLTVTLEIDKHLKVCRECPYYNKYAKECKTCHVQEGLRQCGKQLLTLSKHRKNIPDTAIEPPKPVKPNKKRGQAAITPEQVRELKTQGMSERAISRSLGKHEKYITAMKRRWKEIGIEV